MLLLSLDDTLGTISLVGIFTESLLFVLDIEGCSEVVVFPGILNTGAILIDGICWNGCCPCCKPYPGRGIWVSYGFISKGVTISTSWLAHSDSILNKFGLFNGVTVHALPGIRSFMYDTRSPPLYVFSGVLGSPGGGAGGEDSLSDGVSIKYPVGLV